MAKIIEVFHLLGSSTFVYYDEVIEPPTEGGLLFPDYYNIL